MFQSKALPVNMVNYVLEDITVAFFACDEACDMVLLSTEG